MIAATVHVPPVVFYNRANEAGAMLKAGDFDWDEIFGQGVRWFHSGGIYAALSGTTSGLIVEAMKAAKKHGAITSFDLNYRPKLWAPIGGLDEAQKTFRKIVENVDVLLATYSHLLRKDRVPVFLALIAGILLGKLVYYALKYVALGAGWLGGNLVSTPIQTQLILALGTAAFFAVMKFSEQKADTRHLEKSTRLATAVKFRLTQNNESKWTACITHKDVWADMVN